jgi:hypothetical protein
MANQPSEKTQELLLLLIEKTTLPILIEKQNKSKGA